MYQKKIYILRSMLPVLSDKRRYWENKKIQSRKQSYWHIQHTIKTVQRIKLKSASCLKTNCSYTSLDSSPNDAHFSLQKCFSALSLWFSRAVVPLIGSIQKTDNSSAAKRIVQKVQPRFPITVFVFLNASLFFHDFIFPIKTFVCTFSTGFCASSSHIHSPSRGIKKISPPTSARTRTKTYNGGILCSYKNNRSSLSLKKNENKVKM